MSPGVSDTDTQHHFEYDPSNDEEINILNPALNVNVALVITKHNVISDFSKDSNATQRYLKRWTARCDHDENFDVLRWSASINL